MVGSASVGARHHQRIGFITADVFVDTRIAAERPTPRNLLWGNRMLEFPLQSEAGRPEGRPCRAHRIGEEVPKCR